jgi:hypothetical protein
MGLSFIHTGFLLAGVAAASLPVLIHLLLRQRARVLPIGSVRFLKSVIRQHTRRRRIRQWILLAMRMLAVLLLAAVFARPFFDRSALDGLNQEVTILIDGSASMQTREEDGTVFDSALEAAKSELQELDENTKVHIAMFDATGVAELEIAKLGSARTSHAATDYGEALAWARDLMMVSNRQTRRVVLIADMQRSGLNRTALGGFPANVDLVVRDVGRTMSQNVSIEHSRATVTEIRPKEPVRVNVRLYNAGALPVKNVTVTLDLTGPKGQIRASQKATIAGGARQSIDFLLEQVATDGVYAGYVRLHHTDDLAFDNHRWLAFEARHPDRLLLVDGQEGRSVYTSETYYLETTLRLRAQPGESPTRSFEVERIVWEDGEGFPSLDGFRAIVIANVRRFSDEDVRRLREYVDAGGNVLFFFGDQTKPLQMAKLRDAGLFSGTVARDATLGPWRIDRWDETHPLLHPFLDPQQGDLRMLSFERILEVTDLDKTAQTLISASGRPILVEQPQGDGTMLFFTTAADRSWSDWPQSRLYVPLIRQMLAYLTRQLTGRQAVVEQPLGDGRDAGVFQEDDRTVVRNIDPRESLLDRVSEAEFREAFGLADRDQEAVLEELAESILPPDGAEQPNESWDKVVWILVALLVAELFLASRVHA